MRKEIEDALNATCAAVEDGITVGGGVALVRVGRTLDDLTGDNPDENAGFDETFVIGKVLESRTPAFGFDAARGDYGNLIGRGIVDPVKVVRIALENACAVAGAMITAQVAIADAIHHATKSLISASKRAHLDQRLNQQARNRDSFARLTICLLMRLRPQA